MKVLYTSAELHDAIKHVLGSPTKGERRVVLVAYLGAQAEAFLPNAQGLEVVCSMEPGSTSADAIIRLRDRGVKIRQSDRLHMKVYWSSKKGAVICSANASANALARGGLKEAGVLLPRGAVKVERLLSYSAPRDISNKDLRRLQRESEGLNRGRRAGLRSSQSDSTSLRDWLGSSAARNTWKVGWWKEGGDVAKSSARESLSRYNVKEPHGIILGKKGYFKPADWVLLFNWKTGKQAEWLHVSFVKRVSPQDKGAYARSHPFQAVQVHPNRLCPSPPFRLDRDSRQAIALAVRDFGSNSIERLRSSKLPPRLRSLLKKHSD